MDRLYYKEGIYIIINSEEELNDCIFNFQNGYNVKLFGNRVELSFGGYSCTLVIDGIPISEFKFESYKFGLDAKNEIQNETAVSYLNSIEVNGIESFLENYKKNIEFTYNELKEIYKTEQEKYNNTEKDKHSEILKSLNEIQKNLIILLFILFNCTNRLNIGLENDQVSEVYESIINGI